MAEGFVDRSGKPCGALRCLTTHEEFGRLNLWRPDSFGPSGSRWLSALPTGSRWPSALPTGSRWLSALPTEES